MWWELSDVYMEFASADFVFLLRSAQNCKKCNFLDNLQSINQEGNMENRQMNPFFSSTFSALFITFSFLFENSQNSFWCGPSFVPFWSVKYVNFWQKLPIWTIHHTSLESKYSEVTKNPCYILSPDRSQKKVSAHVLHVIP